MPRLRHAAAVAALALVFLPTVSADDTRTLDKSIVDSLRDVHNKGADLYNAAKDYTGCFRMYEGALRTVRPLLAHKPDAQKIIDNGLATADQEADMARRAFLLHETIEKVRMYLKSSEPAPKPKVEPKPVPTPVPMPKVEPKPVPMPMPKVEPKPTPMPTPKVEPKPVPVPTPMPKVEPKPVPMPKVEPKPVPMPMPKVEPKPTPVPVPMPKVEPKPVPTPAPMPKVKTPSTKVEPKPAATERVSTAKVLLKGAPAAKVDLTFVSLDQSKPRVFTLTTKDDGSYTLPKDMPAGKYTVTATGKDVPAKYGTTTTSGLVVEVKSGTVGEIVLK